MPLAATKIRREHKSVVVVSFHKEQDYEKFQGHIPMAMNLQSVIGLDRPETVPRSINIVIILASILLLLQRLWNESWLDKYFQSLHTNKF